MTKNTDSNFNEHSEMSDNFENFIQAIFNDYESGVIDRTQAVLVIKNAFLHLHKGNEIALAEWLKTGRKLIRSIGVKPTPIIDEFWNHSSMLSDR